MMPENIEIKNRRYAFFVPWIRAHRHFINVALPGYFPGV